MRHSARLAPAGLAASLVVPFLALAGCEEPSRPSLSFALNENIIEDESSDLYVEDLAADRVAQAQLAGALEMLFGTPDAPGFLRPEEWIDDEYDPNLGGEDADWDELVAANESAFAKELEAIAQGNFQDVRLPSHMIRLREKWDDYYAGPHAELLEEIETAAGEGEDVAELESELAALEEEIRADAPDMLRNWYPTLAESAELYRQQCNHCHGVSGGGDGSTAPFLNPRPRDYRRGIFKNTALDNKARPRRADVYRTLEQGIYGTAMPSFKRFTPAELHGLVDYVRLLAIRGETEILLSLEYDADEYGFPMDVVRETYLDVWSKWDEAGDNLIVFDGEIPRSTPERVAHGRELFMDGNSANCVSCHGEDGRGAGPSAFESRPLTDEEREAVSALDERIAAAHQDLEEAAKHKQEDPGHYGVVLGTVARLEKQRFEMTNQRVKDDWGDEIAPRDLNRGLFRFGRRPIDIYRRIYAGINGTPMPSHAAMKDASGNRILTDQDLWDLVHYIRSLSAREMHAAAPSESSHDDGHDHAGS